MTSNSPALYTGSSSTFALEGMPSPANQDLLASEYVVEEAREFTMKPLAIMPPPNNGSSLKSTARTMAPRGGAKTKCAPPNKRTSTGVLGLKRKTPKESGPSLQKGEKYKGSLVTPSGNVVFHSYSSPSVPSASPLPNSCFTIVGVRKPEGWVWEGSQT